MLEGVGVSRAEIALCVVVCSLWAASLVVAVKPMIATPEIPSPAVKQADGSTVLERAPDAQAKPAQQVPKGAKVERVVKIKVQGGGTGLKLPDAGKACPPVTVDLSLVRMPDSTRRVVASSPDGEILSGLDVPVESAAPPPAPKRWAVGVSLNPVRQTVGVWIDRDLARVRVGAEINQTRDFGLSGVEARVKVGMTF